MLCSSTAAAGDPCLLSGRPRLLLPPLQQLTKQQAAAQAAEQHRKCATPQQPCPRKRHCKLTGLAFGSCYSRLGASNSCHSCCCGGYKCNLAVRCKSPWASEDCATIGSVGSLLTNVFATSLCMQSTAAQRQVCCSTQHIRAEVTWSALALQKPHGRLPYCAGICSVC
jgi:hypothetical protein